MFERLKKVREIKKLSQSVFAKELGLGQSTLAMMEVGKRDILDRHIKTICSVFNVREEWLRTGVGEIFNQPETFSLDAYAKENHLSSLELEIVRGYMELNPQTRKALITYLKNIFLKHPDNEGDLGDEHNHEFDDKCESYRKELEVQKAFEMSQALPTRNEDIV